MGVTQSNTLNAIELANNPIPVNLTTDNYISTPGETAWLRLLINSKDDDADFTFQLSWDDNNLVFTSKASPDNSGLQFPYGAGYASIALWLDAIIEYLNKNELLASSFHIWNDSSQLYFESYNTGLEYTLTFSTSDFDWSILNSNTGVDEVLEDNYKIVLSVHVFKETREDSILVDEFDYFELSKQYEIEPLSDGTGLIYIQEAIKPYLKKIATPEFSGYTYGASNVEDYLLRYKYRYSDKYGTPAIQQSTIESDVLYALPGGVTRNDFSNNNMIDLLTGSSAMFLTWHPTIKKITKNQKDYLYYIQTIEDSALNFRFVATKLDGSTATVDVPFIYGWIYILQTIEVSYDYVKSLFSNVELRSYTVQVVDKVPSVVAVSEKRTFNIIQNTPLNAKYYIFRNSFGVFESICFTGENIKGVKLDKLQAKRILGVDTNKSVNEVVYGDKEYNITNKIYTGFKTKSELNAFIDFLNGSDYYEQTDSYFKPVDVDVKSISLYSDADNISSFSLNIIDNTEKNYSNA